MHAEGRKKTTPERVGWLSRCALGRLAINNNLSTTLEGIEGKMTMTEAL